MKKRVLLLSFILSFALIQSAFAQSSQRGLAITPQTLTGGTWGTYHALIIGINDYAKWPRLQTAVKDATVIRDTLIARYGFPKKNVILRTDNQASRQQITRDLRYLAQSMRPEDNLFVYYAGHGQLDDFTGDGYWVPAEGALKDPSTWVANSYIKALLSSEKLQAKNVVVIADSCYSGSMLRGGPSLMSLDDQRYREKLAEKAALRSRQVISSGGVEPVADGGAEGHSLFAFYLIDALRKNQREVIDLENLFHTRVWKPVTEIGDQRPNVGRLKTPMDQDGQFVLYNAAWAREQAARRAAVLEAERQQVAAAEKKAAVASAKLELQRQRFEMEKQKLALEKEQLAQQKVLEMEKLKLEKQKQEIEYARMQARLEEIEAKRKLAEQQAMLAAVDTKALGSSRAAVGSRYKVALFPMQLTENNTAKYLPKAITEAVTGIANIAADDERLAFTHSFEKVDGITEGITLLEDVLEKDDLDSVWMKKSFFAKKEPDWDAIRKIAKKINADLVVMVTGHMVEGSDANCFLYDYNNNKIYHKKFRTHHLTLGTDVEVAARRLVRDFHRNQ